MQTEEHHRAEVKGHHNSWGWTDKWPGAWRALGDLTVWNGLSRLRRSQISKRVRPVALSPSYWP